MLRYKADILPQTAPLSHPAWSRVRRDHRSHDHLVWNIVDLPGCGIYTLKAVLILFQLGKRVKYNVVTDLCQFLKIRFLISRAKHGFESPISSFPSLASYRPLAVVPSMYFAISGYSAKQENAFCARRMLHPVLSLTRLKSSNYQSACPHQYVAGSL